MQMTSTVPLRKTKLTLELLAPYVAVGVFWIIFSNAWLTILAYHAQIILWALRRRPGIKTPRQKRYFLLALPTIVTGPLIYALLPYMTHVDVSTWLADHQLSRISFFLMVPYYGLVHPFLEQVYYTPLREETSAAHVLFAGYHVLVLYSLLTLPWLILSFVVLTTSSVFWKYVFRKSDSLVVPYVSHALADTGIIMTALLRA